MINAEISPSLRKRKEKTGDWITMTSEADKQIRKKQQERRSVTAMLLDWSQERRGEKQHHF